jgi:hypothetical protein
MGGQVEVIGTVVRLQVQRSRLKPGERGARTYDPAPLLEVASLDVGPRGVDARPAGGAGEPVLDVHHADHPDSRNVKLVNGLSLLPRAHYAIMRERFGPHLVDGAAGESLLLDTAGPWTLDALSGALALETGSGGLLPLTGVMVAAPCIEFSRFCLGAPSAEPGSPEVRAAMVDLSDGVRGFYVQVAGEGRVEAGSRLVRLHA